MRKTIASLLCAFVLFVVVPVSCYHLGRQFDLSPSSSTVTLKWSTIATRPTIEVWRDGELEEELQLPEDGARYRQAADLLEPESTPAPLPTLTPTQGPAESTTVSQEA